MARLTDEDRKEIVEALVVRFKEDGLHVTLSDEDISRITTGVAEFLKKEFVYSTGKGVLALAWHGLVLLVGALAMYGWLQTGGK